MLANTGTMPSNEQHYQLWKPRSNHRNGSDANNGGKTTSSTDRSDSHPNYLNEEAEFFRVRNSRFCAQELLLECQQIPPHRSLVELINSTLVVGQEVSLAVILLALHREIVTYEDDTTADGITKKKMSMDHQTLLEYIVEKSSIAILLVYTSLFIITYYNQKAFTADLDDVTTTTSTSAVVDCDETTSQHKHNKKRKKKGHRRKKAIVRLSDGILLAVMLRVISGLLRSLTASYSTDTVYALSISGMVVHLLACDYKFANGHEKEDGGSGGGDTPSLTRRHNPRPKFRGGTVSLNAAFFATVLLISRIKSNATSFAFVSAVVALFAFYPTSRHEIARHFPNRLGVSPCFVITASWTVSAWLLLVSSVERCMFVGLQLFLLLLSPCLQWWLQRYKKIITGKWDIAHINVT